MIFTAVAPGFAASAQVVAAGWRLIPPSSASMTAMSVPTLPGVSSVPVIQEFSGPPNWLKPKLPSGASMPGRGADPPAVAEVGGSSSAIRAVPSSAQCPAVSTTGSPAALNAPNPVEQMVRRSMAIALPAVNIRFGGDRGPLLQLDVGVAGHEVGRGNLPGRRRWRLRCGGGGRGWLGPGPAGQRRFRPRSCRRCG